MATPTAAQDTVVWTTRPEQPADTPAVREIVAAAFPGGPEADLVDALREAPEAWLDGLSAIAETPDGTPVAYALLTRCHIGTTPALALAPCATHPDHQRRGAGSAAIEAVLDAAQRAGENLVVVVGHPEYYPRFGFRRASAWSIRIPFDAPDEAVMALGLDAERGVPAGTVTYPAAFGL